MSRCGRRSSTADNGVMPGVCRVVGFDVDLTLVDTRERIVSSAVAGFADLGVVVTATQIEPHLGIPLAGKVAALAPDLSVEEFVDRYRYHYHLPTAARSPAMPGARDAVSAVHDAGDRVVVVSAKVDWMARAAVEEAGLGELVDTVHGSLFGADKAIALRAERAWVYVGDHPADVAAAHAAAAHAVAVGTGAHGCTALVSAGADTVLPDLRAFRPWYEDYHRTG